MKNYRRKPENPALDLQVRYEHLRDTLRKMVAAGAVRFSPADQADDLAAHGIIECGLTNGRLREILDSVELSVGSDPMADDLAAVTQELLLSRKVLEEVMRWRLGVGSQERVHTVLEAYLRGELRAY